MDVEVIRDIVILWFDGLSSFDFVSELCCLFGHLKGRLPGRRGAPCSDHFSADDWSLECRGTHQKSLKCLLKEILLKTRNMFLLST